MCFAEIHCIIYQIIEVRTKASLKISIAPKECNRVLLEFRNTSPNYLNNNKNNNR